MSSRFSVALIAIGTLGLKVVGVLVALKATVDSNVNSHCWREFGSSKSYSCQECRLPLLTGFFVAVIGTGTSTLNVVGILVGYGQQECQLQLLKRIE